jgi:branched-chain amino acid transport system permease protein
MNLQIALLLAQDGLTNGAIYALLALALVLVFAVTRVIFIPQGEFVAFGALTLASLQLGTRPATIWLLLGAALCVCVLEIVAALRAHRVRDLARIILVYALMPMALCALTWWLAPQQPAMPVQILLSLALVVPLGPLLYRLAYQPLAEASILTLLIVSVAVHFVLTGLGLLFFGAEGSRTTPFSDRSFDIAGITLSAQSLLVIASSVVLIVALALFFGRSLYGKALRATAVNRTGARLVGISTTLAGKLSFTLAALIGACSGILIAPITTVYYDSGFLIGLKGFVGAIIGGLASYPIAAAGAVLVGLLESFSSFWASAFKEVIVFTLIIPVLLWRSLGHRQLDEDEE